MKYLIVLLLVSCLVHETLAGKKREKLRIYLKKVYRSDRLWAQIEDCDEYNDYEWYNIVMTWMKLTTKEKLMEKQLKCKEELREMVREALKDPLGYITVHQPCEFGLGQFNLFWFYQMFRKALPC
ncbi:uncharacterized protein LOC129002198 [Macrosteles quadrilineatus]|uniref:uncharacterized protein LOC129002198 n=1 Tax=Macrosteles quadrilineatus TaxID=74068 RepID=UPI0023E09B2B|nr:uncharacterized protein LOC129002198 [Macrosteles quadrilineatus]